jgi:hypothetical protein
VQLVAGLSTIDVVADLRAVADAERLARLLTDEDARVGGLGAVARTELVGVRVGLDRRGELLDGDEVQVLDVVGVSRGGLATGRLLGDGLETVPGNAIVVDAILGDVEHAPVDTRLVLALTDLVPLQCGHGLLPPQK